FQGCRRPEGFHSGKWQDHAGPDYRNQGALPAPAVDCDQARPLSGAAAVHRSALTGDAAMQVILLEKVLNVGDLGEVVKVKPGFARNFLIPQGKAKRATPENLLMLEEKRAELEKIAAEKLERAQAAAANLDGAAIQITQKAGVD